ncbi:unnamed protein product, partial [Ectocarpus fasciculatus]
PLGTAAAANGEPAARSAGSPSTLVQVLSTVPPASTRVGAAASAPTVVVEPDAFWIAATAGDSSSVPSLPPAAGVAPLGHLLLPRPLSPAPSSPRGSLSRPPRRTRGTGAPGTHRLHVRSPPSRRRLRSRRRGVTRARNPCCRQKL